MNLCYVVAQWVTSQPLTVDMTVTYLSSHRRLELKSDHERKQFSSFCTAHFAPVLRRFPLLQELQNEINCMNDSRDFQDAESVRSGQSHVASQPVFFPPQPDPGGMLSRSIGMPSRKDGPPIFWDTHGISGNVFANPTASSSAPYPQELNPWSSATSETIHSSTEKNDNQTPVQDQRCQSGPLARNSFDLVREGSSKNYGADQQRLQISDLHFDKFPHTINVCLLEDKIQD